MASLRIHAATAMQAFHVLRQAGLMLTSILLAKSALSTEAIGHWEMLLYLGYTFSFFWASGLTQGMLALFPKLPSEEQPAFVFNAYAVFVVAGLAIFIVLYWGQEPAVYWLTHRRELPGLPCFAVFLGLHVPVFLLENLYLLHNRTRSIWAYGWFAALGQAIAVVVPVWRGGGVEGGVLGLAVFAAVRHALLLAFVWRHGAWRIDWGLCRRWLGNSWPLVGYSLLGGLQAALANWLVAFFYPDNQQQFAVYRYGAIELPFALALTTGFGTAMLPVLVQNLAQGMAEMRRRSVRLLHILFLPAMAAMLTASWLFPWVFRAAFRESVPVFQVFLLMLITRVIFSRTVLTALEANRITLLVSIAEITAFAAAGYFLGQWYGLLGIAWATLLAFALEKLLQVLILRKRFGISPGQYTPLGWYVLYSGLLIVLYAMA